MFSKWSYPILILVFVLAVIVGLVAAASVPPSAPVLTPSAGGVLVVPYGENSRDVRSGKIDVDNKVTFIYISKVYLEPIQGIQNCYATMLCG